MIIDLIELNTKGRVDFRGEPTFENCMHPDIKGFENILCAGQIIDNGTEEYQLSFILTGTMILKSAINGSDVHYDLFIKYDEFVANLVENYKKSTNSLDILPILWENILLEIPIRAVNDQDEFDLTEGEGWEVLETE